MFYRSRSFPEETGSFLWENQKIRTFFLSILEITGKMCYINKRNIPEADI